MVPFRPSGVVRTPVVPSAVLIGVGLCLLSSPLEGQNRSVLDLLPVEGRTLEVGSEAQGALSSSDLVSTRDSYVEAWELDGRPGQVVTVDLEASAFDPVLYLVGPGLGETLYDDDGGGGCNARITLTFLEEGTFRVVAGSLGARDTGTYTLRVSERPGPAATHGCGEVDPVVLAGLPTEGRRFGPGELRTGTLDAFAATVQDGRPVEAWAFDGVAGQPVSLVLESDAFDAFLYVTGPGIDGALTDDDGAGDLDARLDFRPTVDGVYTVAASSISAGATGAYTLRAEEPVDLGELPTYGRTVERGAPTTGMLTSGDPVLVDGRQGQAWGFQGQAGDRVVIDLSSDDFDSYLYLAGPGLVEPLSDDDSGGDLDSRITATLPETGEYRIIVSALGAVASGAFSLTLGPARAP